MTPGDIRKGVVKNITDFGAFIDLNGLDGLLHITDMSWGRINHPSEVVHVGQELEVLPVLDQILVTSPGLDVAVAMRAIALVRAWGNALATDDQGAACRSGLRQSGLHAVELGPVNQVASAALLGDQVRMHQLFQVK
jgi:hypothetical protein